MKVYYFKKFDATCAEYLYSRRMATAKSIRLSEAEPLLETEAEISETLVDATGYAPVGFLPKSPK